MNLGEKISTRIMIDHLNNKINKKISRIRELQYEVRLLEEKQKYFQKKLDDTR